VLERTQDERARAAVGEEKREEKRVCKRMQVLVAAQAANRKPQAASASSAHGCV
jgi:hypothetical protein